MTSISEAAQCGLMQFTARCMVESGILDNSYFRGLRSGTMSRQTFAATQRQFFFAVRYFPRTMAALIARFPDSAHRLPLVHNLADEHGLHEDGLQTAAEFFHPALAHDRTILEFLTTLGVSSLEMLQEAEQPAVKCFNMALMGLCAFEPPELALACLGSIEFAFADISALIGQCVTERSWVQPGSLVHYTLHAKIDKRHAADFLNAVQPAWNGGGSERTLVESGVRLGLYVFNRFYEELLREAPP